MAIGRIATATITTVVGLMVLFCVGCSKKSNALNPSTRNVTVDVYNDHVQPSQLTLGTGIAIDLHVTNRADNSCNFYVTNYLQPVSAAAGKNRDVRFTIDTPSGNPTSVQTTTTMGCSGDNQQQGSVVVEFKGVRGGQ